MRKLLKPAALIVCSYALAILTALVSNAKLDQYKDIAANEVARSHHSILTTVADWKWLILVILVAIAGIPTILTGVVAVRARHRARTNLVRRYLRMVQGRAFPNVDGTSANVRVSLFTLSEDAKRLKCFYRTDEKFPKIEWPIETKEGMVVRAFRYQTQCEAKELKPDDPDDLTRYLTETWSTVEILNDRTWKGAAMLAIPVVVRPGDHPSAVFLIEATGTEIEPDKLYDADIDMCCMLMEELP